MTFTVSDHVGEVIHVDSGRCWRYVHDMTRAGAGMPCPEPVVWRGEAEFKAPPGRRVRTVVVESCERHRVGLRDVKPFGSSKLRE
jgi:hypothetical protein